MSKRADADDRIDRTGTEESGPLGLSRRGFLGTMSAGAATSIIGIAGTATTVEAAQSRLDDAYNLRESQASAFVQNATYPSHPDNGDESAYSDRRGSYIKGLTLDHGSPDLGLVDPNAYQSLLDALDTGNPTDFENIATGGPRELVSPQASLRYEMVGLDPQQGTMPAAPSFTSDRMGANMAEVYWHAILRDTAFRDYGELSSFGDPIPQDAAQDLNNNFSDFAGPTDGNGNVTTETLFRGNQPGCLTGPYVSQFLWLDIPSGPFAHPQQIAETEATDFKIAYAEWLDLIEGVDERGGEFPPSSSTPKTGNSVYIRNGRDLGEYVHVNWSYQPYLNAALILLFGLQSPLDPATPHTSQGTESPYVSFGGFGIIDMVGVVAAHAASAAWFHKWQVHRRLRPETYGGRIHNAKTGNASYNISTELLDDSSVLPTIKNQNSTGTYLLPLAYKEGSPAHPSYPSAHAVIAGACVTVLKALFDESADIPSSETVQASRDGTQLDSYGSALNVGDELNKLASNISIGRDFAGVHYRSDAIEGLYLGEQIAHNTMEYVAKDTNEPAPQLTYHDFDGNQVTLNT